MGDSLWAAILSRLRALQRCLVRRTVPGEISPQSDDAQPTAGELTTYHPVEMVRWAFRMAASKNALKYNEMITCYATLSKT